MAFRWIITASRFSGRYALIALMDSYCLISVGFEIMHRRKNEGERRTRKVEWSPNDTLDRFITENLISKHFQSKHFPDSGNLHNLHSVRAQWLAAWTNQVCCIKSNPAFELQLLPLMNKYYQAPIQTAGNLILFHWDFCHCRYRIVQYFTITSLVCLTVVVCFMASWKPNFEIPGSASFNWSSSSLLVV